MRLICPECDAEYEVPGEVIPPSGRDVQCSACDHVWFVRPDDTSGARAATNAPDPWDCLAEPPTVSPDPAPAPAGPLGAPDEETREEIGTATEDAPGPIAAEPQRPRRELDPDMLNILREEAEFSARAREAERSSGRAVPDPAPVEEPAEETEAVAATPSVSMDTSPAARDEAETRDGELPAATDTAGREPTAETPSVLPRAEAISATLATDAARNPGAGASAYGRESRRGKGFLTGIAIGALALAVYVFAPQIAVGVPEFTGALESYVAWVDTLRAWLEGQVSSTLSGTGDDG